jgi:hypothetical protein
VYVDRVLLVPGRLTPIHFDGTHSALISRVQILLGVWKYNLVSLRRKKPCRSQDGSVSTVTWLRAGRSGFDSRQGLGIFLFTTASRPAMGPTQPPIQWVTGVFSPGIKRPGREADHSPPSSAEVKERAELYLHSPVHLHGVMLGLKKAQRQLYLLLFCLLWA